MKVTKRQLNFCTIFHLLLDPNIYQIINEPSDKMYIKDVYQVCTIYSCRDRGVETPGGEGGGGVSASQSHAIPCLFHVIVKHSLHVVS